MVCTDEQKLLFGTHMLSEKDEYWWGSGCQSLEEEGTKITWENFKKEFLKKYFMDDVHSKKEIEFLQLNQGNVIVVDYAAKFEELVRFCLHYNSVEAEGSKSVKFESGLCPPL